jgi:hypothetical protein
LLSKKTNIKQDKPYIYIQFGPSHAQQKPFCWSEYEAQLKLDVAAYNQQNPNDQKTAPTYVHNGAPDCFEYVWEKLPPYYPV